jgi:hypothetical protein
MCSRFPCCALPFLYFLCVVVRSRIFARTLTTLVVLLHRWGRTRLAPPSIKVLSPHRILTDTAARTCAVLRRALPPLRFGFWIQHRPLRSCVDPTITAGPQFCGCVSNSSRSLPGDPIPSPFFEYVARLLPPSPFRPVYYVSVDSVCGLPGNFFPSPCLIFFTWRGGAFLPPRRLFLWCVLEPTVRCIAKLSFSSPVT